MEFMFIESWTNEFVSDADKYPLLRRNEQHA